MERTKLTILMLCIYSLTLLSCVKDKFPTDTQDQQNTTDVTFAVTLPGLSQDISTYAITENEENKLSTVDVLVFKVAGVNETFSYKVKGRNIKPLTANSSQFQVSLVTDMTANVAYRLVVIANARAEVDGINISANEQKATTLGKLIVNKQGVWKTNSVTDYNPLPMWGESAPVAINNNLTAPISLSLLRTQARVDVNVSAQAQPVFSMTSISVYNTNANARIAPLPASYNTATQKVTTVSLPDVLQTNAGPLLYTIQSPLKSEHEIYLFEKGRIMNSGVPAPPGDTKSASLIIGGHYNGSSVETYYKIEFLSNEAIPAPLPLLRNHKYVFNILQVGGAGYATKEMAMTGKPSNMQVTTTIVDLNDMPIVYFDEHYYLALQTELLIYPTLEARSEPYKIYTNFPSGWTYTSDSPWLTVSPNGANTAYINIAANTGTPPTTREGILTISAGKIRAKIKVVQGASQSISP
ncbi:Major fimbrial subunit protein (FimA) [Sphingobacterium spiritivorum]|uniref:Major fimbrial subunit protein (FimA) n=1 Tax=Sphingobacterium spiritivorum TaxID=258 RepID=A0A380BUQ2_SPHSI|nr:BACON domain-containing protein [Sphingobacterium spiritivorum]SUJ06434.1 Major fimbrial subunit protein (FimA) [Sphingobacterium spiritivorum]